MKFLKLITLTFLLVLPQVQQAWGTSHCVTNCHEEQAHQESEHENSKKSEEGTSHQHAHHCAHSFALTINFALLQNPSAEFKELVYHFTIYDSEPHLYVYIEPPILSTQTFA